MGIELVTAEGKTDVTEENFADSMQKLENMLKPGMPVLIRNYTHFNVFSQPKHAREMLFFYGGELKWQGKRQGELTVQKGKRNFVVTFVNGASPEKYQIARSIYKKPTESFGVPHRWEEEVYNEGTFSPAGPSIWTTVHRAGTESIVVGDALNDRFPNAIRALRFAGDAVYFKLNGFYSGPNIITEIGASATSEQGEQRDSLTRRMACLNAVMNLLKESERIVDPHHDNWRFMEAAQVGWYASTIQDELTAGYPVDKEDYCLGVAFVKVEKGIFPGEAYILPAREKMDELVELAFSEEMVRKHYPHGLKR